MKKRPLQQLTVRKHGGTFAMKESTVLLTNRPGECRWCKCTYEHACPGGCDWVDRAQTLCTACEPLDTAIKTSRGRRRLAEYLHESSFIDLMKMPLTAKAGRR